MDELPAAVLLELTDSLVHVISLSILEGDDESLRKLIQLFLAQAIDFVVIGGCTQGVFHQIAFLETIVIGFALEMSIALAKVSTTSKI